MAVSQSLSVTEVANSPNVANNTSQVRIIWTSTQTNDSHNLNTKTAYYYVSINGGAETKYSVAYTLPEKTTKTILDTTLTIPHKSDGSGTVKVRTYMETGISAGTVEKSQSVTLTTIARASQPSCITWPNNTRNVGYFGDTITIHMNRLSGQFTHKVFYSFGNRSWYPIKSGVTDNTQWTIPLDLLDELTSVEKSGWGYIIVETYTDNGATYVGYKTCEFVARVPDIRETKPTVTMTLSPVGALTGDFEGLYIQGLTKVKATLSASGKYGATIGSYFMKLDNVLHDKDDAYTSSYLSGYGEKIVYGYATDSREITGETSQTINVIPYSYPKLIGATAVRCDENGNESESGTYLKISGERDYSPCILNGVQKNFCQIEYRWSQDNVHYSDWKPILKFNDLSSNKVATTALDGVSLSAALSYVVHIRAIDTIGRVAESFVTIPTDKVYMHRDGARNALGLGKYNEKDNAVDSAWDIYIHDNKVIPDVKINATVVREGWYKIGTIEASMCSVTTLTIGGEYYYDNVTPSMVDIATHYNVVKMYLRLPALVDGQISKIGIVKEDELKFGVYVYYNSSNMNYVSINIHSHMGEFQKSIWEASNLTDSDLIEIINLKQ